MKNGWVATYFLLSSLSTITSGQVDAPVALCSGSDYDAVVKRAKEIVNLERAHASNCVWGEEYTNGANVDAWFAYELRFKLPPAQLDFCDTIVIDPCELLD